MKRKRRIKKYRSLADVRFVKVLLDFASGLSVPSKPFANLWPECYLETKEEYENKDN